MLDPLEEAIELRSRVRILGVITREKKLTITQLSRLTGLNHEVITKAIEVLHRMNLVKVYKQGHNQIIESCFRSLAVNFEKGSGMKIVLV
jgi:predicted transcriptional regulator